MDEWSQTKTLVKQEECGRTTHHRTWSAWCGKCKKPLGSNVTATLTFKPSKDPPPHEVALTPLYKFLSFTLTSKLKASQDFSDDSQFNLIRNQTLEEAIELITKELQ